MVFLSISFINYYSFSFSTLQWVLLMGIMALKYVKLCSDDST